MKFAFREQLQDLLNDFFLFGDVENLCVNKTTADNFKPLFQEWTTFLQKSLEPTGTEGPVTNFQAMR
jgi:hypothetical protein